MSSAMLSDAQIDAYRRMTPDERWRIVEELMTLAWRSLLELPPDERERRLALIREEHDASNAAILEFLRKHP
jgi:hypothetical protein